MPPGRGKNWSGPRNRRADDGERRVPWNCGRRAREPSKGGKCGAVLAAEQFIRENGTEKDVEEFDRRFIEKNGHLTCFKLRGLLGQKCNDYVGEAAAIVANMGITKDGE